MKFSPRARRGSARELPEPGEVRRDPLRWVVEAKVMYGFYVFRRQKCHEFPPPGVPPAVPSGGVPEAVPPAVPPGVPAVLLAVTARHMLHSAVESQV